MVFTKTKRANGKGWRVGKIIGSRQLSNTLNRLPGMYGAISPPLKPV